MRHIAECAEHQGTEVEGVTCVPKWALCLVRVIHLLPNFSLLLRTKSELIISFDHTNDAHILIKYKLSLFYFPYDFLESDRSFLDPTANWFNYRSREDISMCKGLAEGIQRNEESFFTIVESD